MDAGHRKPGLFGGVVGVDRNALILDYFTRWTGRMEFKYVGLEATLCGECGVAAITLESHLLFCKHVSNMIMFIPYIKTRHTK